MFKFFNFYIVDFSYISKTYKKNMSFLSFVFFYQKRKLYLHDYMKLQKL